MPYHKRFKKTIILALFPMIFLLYACEENEVILNPEKPLQGGHFGAGVAISSDGDTIAVGAANDGIVIIGGDENSDEQLMSYLNIYRRKGGGWEHSYAASSKGRLGQEVKLSADGNTLVAGSRGYVNVLKYDGNEWETIGYFSFPNEQYPDYADVEFGEDFDLSADGNRIVVGHPNGNGTRGIVYVYNWDPINRAWNGANLGSEPEPETLIPLTASDGIIGDHFGHVAISGDGKTIAVGAVGEWQTEDEYGTNGSKVYLFEEIDGTFIETDKITASCGHQEDDFGRQVALSENGRTLLVAAPGKSYQDDEVELEPKQDNQGAVYIYDFDGLGWNETLISGSETKGRSFFGRSIAMSASGESILVGAPGSIWQVPDHKVEEAVYFFDRIGGEWQETRMQASNGSIGDTYGCSVAISGDGQTGVVGAEYARQNLIIQRAGRAYIYER